MGSSINGTPNRALSVPGPKQEPQDMTSLVAMKDQLTAAQSIEYLKRIIDCQKRVGAPGDDVGVIFDKIQVWKQK